MNQKEIKKYSDVIKKFKNDQYKQLEIIRDLAINNINQIRKFRISLIGFSLIIASIVITVLTNGSQFFNSPVIAWSGIVFILIGLFFNILGLSIILGRERKNIRKKYDFYNNTMSEAGSHFLECFKKQKSYDKALKDFEEKIKEFRKTEISLRKNNNRKSFFIIISLLFLFGLILIILSVF